MLHVHHSTQLLCIPDTSISMLLLHQNILSQLLHFHFYVSTRPKYSCTSLRPPFLCISSTKIFLHLCISDTSPEYTCLSFNHFVSTRPKYSCASLTSTSKFLISGISLTKIFLNHCIIISDTRPKYSCTSLNHFLRIYSTQIFLRTPQYLT